MDKPNKIEKMIIGMIGSINPGHFGKTVYKGTECGPWLAYLIPTHPKADKGETADMEAGWVHYDDAWGIVPPKSILGVKAGSIVEGSDATVGPEDMLLKDFSERKFWKMIEYINNQACALWEQAHSTYFKVEYRGQPHTKPIPLWGKTTSEGKLVLLDWGNIVLHKDTLKRMQEDALKLDTTEELDKNGHPCVKTLLYTLTLVTEDNISAWMELSELGYV